LVSLTCAFCSPLRPLASSVVSHPVVTSAPPRARRRDPAPPAPASAIPPPGLGTAPRLWFDCLCFWLLAWLWWIGARFAYWPWNVRIRCSLSRSGCVCDRGREKIRLASDEFCLFSRGDLSVILLRACVVSLLVEWARVTRNLVSGNFLVELGRVWVGISQGLTRIDPLWKLSLQSVFRCLWLRIIRSHT